MNHNSIIATTWSDDKAKALQEWIAGLAIRKRDLFVTCGSWVNGYTTFVLCPDGSKEGWQDSTDGDDLRNCFVARLSEDNYDDGSSPWDWIEVGYGEFGQKVLQGNCTNYCDDRDYAVG